MTGYKVFMGDLQLLVSPQTIITKTRTEKQKRGRKNKNGTEK